MFWQHGFVLALRFWIDGHSSWGAFPLRICIAAYSYHSGLTQGSSFQEEGKMHFMTICTFVAFFSLNTEGKIHELKNVSVLFFT